MTDGAGRFANRAAWAVTLACAAVSIGLRVWVRGDHVPGWDLMGTAEGVILLWSRSLRDVVDWYVRFHADGAIFWNLYVVPAVLVPGALAYLAPWLYWAHVVTFAVALVVVVILARAFMLGWRDAWIVPLAWMTSPALVSQSVTGLPVVTSLLPHAAAVWAVLRLRERPLATVVAAVVVWLLGGQGQELGRTAGVVFLAGAVTLPARRGVRAVWVLAGVLILGHAVRYPSANTAFFSSVAAPAVGRVVDVGIGIGTRLFAPPWIDLPTLVVLGALATVLLRREAWCWRILLAFQLGLVLVLGLQREATGVWPRRFIVVDFYALVAVVALLTEWRRQQRRVPHALLVGALVLGAGWQTADTVRFARDGYEPAVDGSVFTMPFVHTTVDYQVQPQDVRWARIVTAEAMAGRRLLLAYNLSSYEENATNPFALPERLLIQLGPMGFARQVAIFGTGWRWTMLRARSPATITRFVDGIRDPAEWVGWYALHPNDEWPGNETAARRSAEVDALLAALQRRFVLRWEPPLDGAPSHIQRFTLAWPESFERR